MHIDRYLFGSLVADGREFRTDVLITPAGVRDGWRRREGHVVRAEDLSDLLEDHPERLVIGTGAYGRMRPAPDLGRELAQRGVIVEEMPTAAAVERINEMLRVGAAGWAGALQLTC